MCLFILWKKDDNGLVIYNQECRAYTLLKVRSNFLLVAFMPPYWKGWHSSLLSGLLVKTTRVQGPPNIFLWEAKILNRRLIRFSFKCLASVQLRGYLSPALWFFFLWRTSFHVLKEICTSNLVKKKKKERKDIDQYWQIASFGIVPRNLYLYTCPYAYETY